MGSVPETYHFINGTLTLGSERGRGCLIPYSRTFFTTIPYPKLLKSLPLIPLSFPIPHPVPRFRRIPPVEYRSNLVSRPEFFRFPESRTVFRPNLGSRRKIPFQTLCLDDPLLFAALLFVFYVSDSNISRGPVIFSLFFSFVI